MEVLCIDDFFTSDTLEFYQRFGVIPPVKGTIYSIRDVINHITGETGLLLNEIINPEVPINSSIGIIHREPTWHIRRFRTLLGLELKKEDIKIEKYVEEYK